MEFKGRYAKFILYPVYCFIERIRMIIVYAPPGDYLLGQCIRKIQDPVRSFRFGSLFYDPHTIEINHRAVYSKLIPLKIIDRKGTNLSATASEHTELKRYAIITK